MKKVLLPIITFLFGAALGLLIAPSLQYQSTQQKPLVKVGVIAPLTGGDFAALGEEVRKGTELAATEIEEQGMTMKLIFEDSENFSVRASANAANKLLNADKVEAGLVMTIEEAKPTAEIFNNYRVPVIAMWDANNFLKEAGEYTFSNGFSTEHAGELMAEFAYQTLGVRNVGVVSNQEAWGEIISEAFSNKLSQLGGTVPSREQLSVEAEDYRSTLLKFKQARVDGIYFPLLFSSAYVGFLKQIHELGLNVPLMTGDAFIQEAITQAGDTAEGVYLTDIYTELETSLTQNYRTRYNREPLDVRFVSFGYEGLFKLKEGIDHSRSKNISLRDALEQVFGPTRSADRVEKIFQVKNRKPVQVDK